MMKKSLLKVLAVLVASGFLQSCASVEWPANKIDSEANLALQVFRQDITGAQQFLDQAAGYLIFPRIIKAGVGIGAETGEGALRIGGRSVDYYRTTGGSFGFQAGAQAKSVLIAFMTRESLAQFRKASGWKVGIDGSIAIIDIGAGKTIDSDNIRDPVIGFIFGSKGLMYNLTLEGSKFSKLHK
jgi:lipid-binding SYLF domain-containing protein